MPQRTWSLRSREARPSRKVDPTMTVTVAAARKSANRGLVVGGMEGFCGHLKCGGEGRKEGWHG